MHFANNRFNPRLSLPAFVLIVCVCFFGSCLVSCKDSGKPVLAKTSDPQGHSSVLSGIIDLDADIKILFLGNSHTAVTEIPTTVARILNQRQSHKKVMAHYLSGAFLDVFLEGSRTEQIIKQVKWDIVVLQGQKISSSGKYIYSTDAAEKLSLLAKESGAQVILFCEWGRFMSALENDPGKIGETQRIQKIYQQIADKTGATIAPVGLVWETAKQKSPTWHLHASDGNHANDRGGFLTSLVMQEVIAHKIFTDEERRDLKDFEPLELPAVDAKNQETMSDIAREAIDAFNQSVSDAGRQSST
jgi:hypothetical protein